MIVSNYRINYVCEEAMPILENYYDNVGDIYAHMGDDSSREIYQNRTLAALTMDTKYIKNVIDMVPEAQKLYLDLEKYERVYIYGAGIMGTCMNRYFPDINWVGYLDQFSVKK